jgi:hypothetical protein
MRFGVRSWKLSNVRQSLDWWPNMCYVELLRASEGTLSRWSRVHLQSLAPTNPHWACVVGYGPFSLCVILRKACAPAVGSFIGWWWITWHFLLASLWTITVSPPTAKPPGYDLFSIDVFPPIKKASAPSMADNNRLKMIWFHAITRFQTAELDGVQTITPRRSAFNVLMFLFDSSIRA